MAVDLESEVLDEQAIKDALKELDGWSVEAGALQKAFTNNSFLEAIAFVNRVAVVAEKLDHHPDFDIHYKRVTLRCWTHKKNAITKADIALAMDIEAVA